MATVGNQYLTMADWASRVGTDGGIDDIIEVLAQSNEILDDLPWKEGNLATGHKHTVRTGFPTMGFRAFYEGVKPSKSSTTQFTDVCGMFDGLSQVDVAAAKLGGKEKEFRLSEDDAFLVAMGQKLAGNLFYSNHAMDPKGFMGLFPRYATINPASAAIAKNVIDAGGTGSTNTSIFLAGWGEKKMFGIFPLGSKAGIEVTDLPKAMVDDGNGGKYLAYQTYFSWAQGIAVPDWRFGVRIPNIDVTQLSGQNAPNLLNLLVRAANRLPTTSRKITAVQGSDDKRGAGAYTPVFYCNRTVRTWLEIQVLNKTNVYLTVQDVGGEPMLHFRGIPIKTCDALLNTESRVV
ncbi:MAG: hypothetical protein HQM01_08235 [Magnetococcales bacterium]|nr:hypothetical protein [Magnetococcales bacterium]